MSHSSGKILVADDENSFREPTIELLRRAGWEPVGAANGSEAMSIALQGDIDLVISDIHMQGNSRLELVTELHDAMPRLPIILVTGLPSVETSIPAVELSVVAYLVKPISPKALLNLVRRTLQQYQACRAVDESLRRLDQWQRDLQTTAAVLRPKADKAFNQSLGTFLGLTFNNLVGALRDTQRVIEVMSADNPSPQVVDALKVSKPLQLIEAITDTIRTIERTKASFKSKELGNLRSRLESLLRESTAQSPPSPAPADTGSNQTA